MSDIYNKVGSRTPTCGLKSSIISCSDDSNFRSICSPSRQRLGSNWDSSSCAGINSFSMMLAMGSMIFIKTLWARILTFIHALGKASLSRMDDATLKNWERRLTNLSRPSMSKLDSRKLVMCFTGEASMRTRNTIATSPRPG